MDKVKVNDLSGEFLEVVVPDYLARKRYFADSEVSGWVITKDGEKNNLYFLYRRGYDTSTNTPVHETFIFSSQALQGEEREKEVITLLEEAEIQQGIGENTELLGKIRQFLAR